MNTTAGRALGDTAEHCVSAIRQWSTIWRWNWRVSVSWRHSLCRARDHERKWPVAHKCCRYAQARLGSGADVDSKNTRVPLSSTDWPAAGWTSSRTTLHQCRPTLCQLSSWQSSADRNRRFVCRLHRHGGPTGDVWSASAGRWRTAERGSVSRPILEGLHAPQAIETTWWSVFARTGHVHWGNKPLNHDAVKTVRRL